MSGRNAEDLASSYVKAMRLPTYRDNKNVVFWTNNCGAQKKNWVLFTAMVAEVNRPGGPETITIKYLENGCCTFTYTTYNIHMVLRGDT